jgi:hypothetical protein
MQPETDLKEALAAAHAAERPVYQGKLEGKPKPTPEEIERLSELTRLQARYEKRRAQLIAEASLIVKLIQMQLSKDSGQHIVNTDDGVMHAACTIYAALAQGGYGDEV